MAEGWEGGPDGAVMIVFVGYVVEGEGILIISVSMSMPITWDWLTSWELYMKLILSGFASEVMV
jgi:hypothetical protein